MSEPQSQPATAGEVATAGDKRGDVISDERTADLEPRRQTW
jgi:hypothetical protein